MLNYNNISGLQSRVNTAQERIGEWHGISITKMPKVKHREKRLEQKYNRTLLCEKISNKYGIQMTRLPENIKQHNVRVIRVPEKKMR